MGRPRRFTLRTPRIFLSYRHADSAGQTGRIFECLAETFGDDHVFLDTTDLRPADHFWDDIQAELAKSTSVIAVVGRHWLVTEDGQRRLDDPKDFVRRELAWALEHDKHMVPVCVDGGSMPREEDLPEGTGTFALIDAMEMHRDDFPERMGRLIGLVDARIVSPRVLRAVALVVLVAAAAWVGALDWINIGTENVAIAIADVVAPVSPSSAVVLVSVDAEAEAALSELGPFGPSWRRMHARLIDAVSQAGANVIAFDMSFDVPSEPPAVDEELAAAMKRARDRGTRIIVTAPDLHARDPVIPVLKPVVTIAVPCIGRVLHRASRMPIAIVHDMPDGQRVVRPSLALLAAFQLDGVDVPNEVQRTSWDRFFASRPEVMVQRANRPDTSVTGAWTEDADQTSDGCKSLSVGDKAVMFMLRLSPLAVWRSPPHRVPYASVVAAPPSIPMDGFKDKIVVVGRVGDPNDSRQTGSILFGESRAGAEIHADAISNLMASTAIWPIDERTLVVFTAFMGWVGWKLRRRDGRLASIAIVTVGCAVLVALTVTACGLSAVLVSIPYPLSAFVVAYLTAGRPIRPREDS